MLGKRLQVANRVAKKSFMKWFGVNPDNPDELLRYANQFINKEDVLNNPWGTYRKTRVHCSNLFCCGNPRRVRGQKNLTRQEMLFN